LALTPQNSETFYREVDEELRRDQLTGFFRRYGIWLAVAVLLILAITGGVIWWQHYQRTKAEQQAEQLDAIFSEIDAGKTKGLDTRLDQLAGGGNQAYRAAALLTKADLALEAGNADAAAKTYGQVAADEDVDELYRQLALIRQTATEYDKLPPADVINRLKPLAVQGNPWFGSAGEMVAIAHLKQKRPDLAAPIFAAMAKDEKVPETIRIRARDMAGSLGVDVGDITPAAGAAGATKE
jgi:hypothetical protein